MDDELREGEHQTGHPEDNGINTKELPSEFPVSPLIALLHS